MFLFRKQVKEKKEEVFVDYKVLSAQEIQKLQHELIELAAKYINNPDWEQFDDQQCDKYSLDIEGRVATKGEMTLEFSTQTIVEYLKDPISFKKTDVMMEDVNILEQGKGYEIAYLKFKGMWPVASRDLIIYGIRKQVGDVFYLVSKSISYNHPSPQGLVRAECYIGAYVLKKLSPTSTRVTYVSDVDVKGMIPGFIKNMVSKYQASVPLNLNRRLLRQAEKQREKETEELKQKKAQMEVLQCQSTQKDQSKQDSQVQKANQK